MYGGTAERLPPSARGNRQRPPASIIPGRGSRRFSPSSWTWTLCAVFTVAGLQALICIDDDVHFNPFAHPVGGFQTVPLSVADRAGAVTAGAPQARTGGGFSIGIAAAAAAPAAEHATIIRISDPPPRQAVPPPNELARCFPTGSFGAVPTSGRPTGEPMPGPANSRISGRCAALMGIILLGAGDPKLRFR